MGLPFQTISVVNPFGEAELAVLNFYCSGFVADRLRNDERLTILVLRSFGYQFSVDPFAADISDVENSFHNIFTVTGIC